LPQEDKFALLATEMAGSVVCKPKAKATPKKKAAPELADDTADAEGSRKRRASAKPGARPKKIARKPNVAAPSEMEKDTAVQPFQLAAPGGCPGDEMDEDLEFC
jgi:hypothetical protein